MVWDVPDYLFEKNYALCLEYYRTHGDVNIPTEYVAQDGTRLGAWIHNIRTSVNGSGQRAILSDGQKARLDELGFVWENRHNATWERSYRAAVKYQQTYGNLDIPVAYTTEDGIALGRWIRRQRDGKLSEERRKKLDAIGMIWNTADPWEEKFTLVKRYFDENGDVNIPADCVVEGVWIARWLSEQVARMNGKPTGRAKTIKRLTDEQIKKLKSLGIRENTTRNDLAWEEQYRAAQSFYQNNGHLLIPKTYVSGSGKSVGRWIQSQRANRKQGKLTEKQVRMLDEIGMVWSVEIHQTVERAYPITIVS